MPKKNITFLEMVRFIETSNNLSSYIYGTEVIFLKEPKELSGKALSRQVRFINFAASLIGIKDFKIETNKILEYEKSGKVFVPIIIADKHFFITMKGTLDGLRIPQILENNESITHIVSGPCLFSKESVKAIAEDGTEYSLTDPPLTITKKIQTIKIDPVLSLYENESIFRLASFINSLFKSSPIEGLFLNVPETEYYLYILDAFDKNFLTSQQALEWFDKVDKRYRTVIRLMKKKSLEDISQKSIPKIRTLSPLKIIKDYIRAHVSKRRKVHLRNVLLFLKKSSPLWDELLSLETPSSWYELNNLSYVYAEIYSGYFGDRSNKLNCTVVVEDPMEDRILIHARKILKNLQVGQNSQIIAFYPHEFFIPTDGQSLYDTQVQNIYSLVPSAFEERMI